MDSKEPSKVGEANVNSSLTADPSSQPPVKLSKASSSKVLVNQGNLNPASAVTSHPNSKPPKKVAAEKVHNLPEAELKALLDEAVKYRGKKDREQSTALFQELLRETQESGEESPPAFRPTENSLNSTATQQRRRRSRKECLGPFPGTPPSVQSNSSVAGSNRKGGSLQNISSHSQCEWGSVRRRKRHDTSDSGSTGLGSPRKREGGSLPCDVARGSQPPSAKLGGKPAESALRNPVTDASGSAQDCVIDMEGLTEDARLVYASADRYPQPWNIHPPSSSARTPCERNTSGRIEQMELEVSRSKVEEEEETTQREKLLSGSKATMASESGSSTYGTMSSCRTFTEVDEAIPFGGPSTTNHCRSSPQMTNGAEAEETHVSRRSQSRRIGEMDENGNPSSTSSSTFTSSVNGTSFTLAPQLLQARTSPSSGSSPASITLTTGPGNKTLRTGKSKKRNKEDGAVLSNNIVGFRGDKDVDELLEYIESSEGGAGAAKKAGEKSKPIGSRQQQQNGGSIQSSSAASSSAGRSAKGAKNTSVNNKQLRRVLSNEADSEGGESAEEEEESHPSSGRFEPPRRRNSNSSSLSPFRKGLSAGMTAADGSDELSLAASSEFQTVTKRQKRNKKRNASILSSSGGRSSAKELLDGHHGHPASSPSLAAGSPMTNHLFHNASSPSVLMRPSSQSQQQPQQHHHQQHQQQHQPLQQQQQRHHHGTGSAGGGVGAGGGGGGGVSGSVGIGSSGNEAQVMKKAIASVPPSEPSDLDSDGGDSVHSLPIQPSAPLYFPPLPSYHHRHHHKQYDHQVHVQDQVQQQQSPASISYADIIRADKSGANNVGLAVSMSAVCTGPVTDLSFLAEPSQPVDILVHDHHHSSASVASPTDSASASLPLIAATAAAGTGTAANVPSSRKRISPKATGVPLRRAASLPPTSPSQETPPVVIVGLSGASLSSAASQLDVTFGFELNEQLLALSLQQPQPGRSSSPPSSPMTKEARPTAIDSRSTAAVVAAPSVASTLDSSSFVSLSSPTSSTATATSVSEDPDLIITPPSSPPDEAPSPPVDQQGRPCPSSAAAIDFAARYRERPELLNLPSSRRSYEILDFISQAWKRIERKLDEQQHNQIGRNNLQTGGIRVYTLE